MTATTVLLVHGAWAGSWAWGFLSAELDARGVPHATVDLPSREPGPGTLADDARAVRAAIADVDAPAVLCGHSYGGMVITEASAGCARVAHLVYLCATMPDADESVLGLMSSDPVPSTIGASLRTAGDGTATLDPSGAREVILSDASDDQAAMVLGALGSHRMGTFGEAVAAVGWREHPSTYVVCSADRLFSEALQTRMARRAGTVVRLDSGHAPMLTRPGALADLLAGVAVAGATSAAPSR